MHCTSCGQPVDGRFCRNCGAAVAGESYGERFSRMTPTQQTISSDLHTIALLIATLVGLLGGAALWLWLLYDESVVSQSMIWFLGAFPAAVVGALVARWAVVAIWTR